MARRTARPAHPWRTAPHPYPAQSVYHRLDRDQRLALGALRDRLPR